MPKPVPPTITVLPTSNLVFGGHVDFSCSVPIDATTQVGISVQMENGAVGLGGYSSTYPDGDHTFALGPTPVWSSGGGTGTLFVATFNARKGVLEPVRGTSVGFTVAP